MNIEHVVQVNDGDCRSYEKDDGTVELKYGITWSLQRWEHREDEPALRQTIVTSVRVFETSDEARQDAFANLVRLRCPIERPVDQAIRWMLQGG